MPRDDIHLDAMLRHLIGIASRRDLLSVFLRPDAGIAEDATQAGARGHG